MGGTDWQEAQHPSGSGSGLIAACIILSVIQILFVAARFYTRFMQKARCGADDYVMLVALTGSLTRAVMYIVLAEEAGLGYHMDELTRPNQDMTLIRKGFVILEILDFPFTVTPAKISLLLFYMRIFDTKKFHIIAYSIGALVLGLGITVFFETIFQCTPIQHGWSHDVPGTCIDQTTFYRAVSPVNIATGLMIMALPIPFIWKLHAPRSQKIALTCVFLLSGLGTVVSILRVAIYFTSIRSQLSDVTWFSIKLGVLTVVEGAIIIIATCLVSIWPLVIKCIPNTLLSKLSCCAKRNHHIYHHQQWYVHSVREQPKTSRDQLAPSITSSLEESWGSRPSSLAELEDQRLFGNDVDLRQHPLVLYEVHITAGDAKV
ncbi:hypothetical protein N7478_002519 [Penicillium angulare]|uniref:uncharacterized protein n=1 Tax=Penicillium angulare TaxID=116970 RepID=UPI002541565A|nr:uncharacterized protein N7478_002519 [Penicillium angulare]KAJ5286833.1 hypothetical protein N7478_002519 [Penicillium angulare]